MTSPCGSREGPGGRPLTDEQLEAVELREGPLLLSANAGSGKTTVMVERFVRAVLCDGVELTAILAITFTDKAAAELRSRIRARLRECGAVEAARDLEQGWVSTIHGFCARVLRSHPLDAGLDPRFAVLDEPAAQRLAHEAFADAFAAVLAAGGDPAVDALSRYQAEADLRDMVLAAHGHLRTRGARRPELPPAAPRDPVAAAGALRRAAAALLAALPTPGTRSEQAAAEMLRACLDTLPAGSPVPAGALAAFKPPGRTTAALREAAADAYQDAWKEAQRAAFDAEAAEVYAWLRRLVAEFGDRYAALKARRSGLDFDDLELAARDLLAARPALRARYAERFTHIMVDEFQDTNPLQLELLEMLARDNLFAVGDEFQSIYRFRHADVELFRTARAARDTAGRARSLARNYRSGAPLLAVLNVAFAGEVFPAGFVPLEPADAGGPGEAEPAVELLVTDTPGAWAEEDLGEAPGAPAAWRLAEARLLADRIAALHAAGRPLKEIVVLLRATGDMRTYERALEERGIATYLIGGRGFWAAQPVRDLVAYLAVLANPRDDLRLYEALASPIGGLSSDALFAVAQAAQRREGRAWEAIERAFGAEADPDAPDSWPDGLAARDRARLAAFCTTVRRHRALAPRLALDTLIDRVAADTQFDLAVLAMPGGRRRLANVRKLMRLAREYEAAEGRSLRGLVDHVDDLAGDTGLDSREGEAPVEGEDLAAVRIMTIHRAKGLEFPVVCVADLGRLPFTGGRQYLRLGDNGEVGLKVPGLEEGRNATPVFGWDAIGATEEAADAEEEKRLFYVAMTRAQEYLILSGAADLAGWHSCRAPIGWIAPALAPGLDGHDPAADPRPEIAVARRGFAGRVAVSLNCAATLGDVLPRAAMAPAPITAEGGGAVPALPPPSLHRDGPDGLAVDHISYSSLEQHHRCGYRFYLERVLRLPADPGPLRRGDGGLSGLVRGSIVHAALERLDLARPEPPDDGELDGLAAAEGAALGAADRDDLRALVAAFASSPLRARLAAAARVRREAGFSYLLDVGRAEPLRVTGAVDALGEEPGGGLLVVDYKTDRVAPGDDLEARAGRDYGIQRAVYALAALRAGAPTVEVVHCFLERPEDLAAARYVAGDRPGLEAALAAAAAGILDGEFVPSPAPWRGRCSGCPGANGLCVHGTELTSRDASGD